MRTCSVLLLALASALLISPTAAGKGVSKMEVCGAAACVALPGDGEDLEALMAGSSTAGPPVRPSGWYAVRTTVTPSRGQGEDFEPFTFREAYVPSAGLLRVRAEGGGFEWRDMSARYDAAMRKATAGLEPRPAERLRGLDAVPVEAKVHKVVPAPVDAPSGGAPWAWIALAGGSLGLVAAIGVRACRFNASRPPSAGARRRA
jgi:hypothetical protein